MKLNYFDPTFFIDGIFTVTDLRIDFSRSHECQALELIVELRHTRVANCYLLDTCTHSSLTFRDSVFVRPKNVQNRHTYF